MKVKEIELCFENLEICKLKPSMFKYLIIQGIKIKRTINCYQYENGEMQSIKTCEYLHIEINKKGLKQKCWLQTLEERLKGNDIASIILYYDDNTEEEIYVIWGKDDYINEYQKTTYTAEGNLEIEVKADT